MSRISIDAGLKLRPVSGGGGGSFDPSAITGYMFDLDADDIDTFTFSSGSVISQWSDKSGSANHFSQSTVAAQPSRTGTQNGRSTVVFDGSDDFIKREETAVLAQPYTLFIVARYITRNTFKNFTDCATNTNRGIFSGDTNWRIHSGGAILDSGVAGDTSWHVHTAKFAGSSSKIRLDGVQIASGDPGTHNWGWGAAGQEAIIGGGNGGGGLAAADCQIARMLGYSGALSDTDCQYIEDGLKDIWGTP